MPGFSFYLRREPEAASQHSGQVPAALEGQGSSIGNNDLWIAAYAHAEGCTLINY